HRQHRRRRRYHRQGQVGSPAHRLQGQRQVADETEFEEHQRAGAQAERQGGKRVEWYRLPVVAASQQACPPPPHGWIPTPVLPAYRTRGLPFTGLASSPVRRLGKLLWTRDVCSSPNWSVRMRNRPSGLDCTSDPLCLKSESALPVVASKMTPVG